MTVTRWNSTSGREWICEFLTNRWSTTVLAKSPPQWVIYLLYQWKRRLRKHRPWRGGLLARASRRIAHELDLFASKDVPTTKLLDRLEDRSFRGSREDLVSVLADHSGRELARRGRRTGTAPRLRGADLTGMNLQLIDFTGADLRGAWLSRAIARRATFVRADLREAHCHHTDFSHADLRQANLSGARLLETMLIRADLRNASLRRAELLGTMMNRSLLQGADLRGALVWGVAAWDIEVDARTRQQGMIVAPGITSDPHEWDADRLRKADWTIPADDLEVAQFITMLASNPKIGSVINASADKVVLLLGRFVGKERAILDSLREAMPSHGYVPVVFDFDVPQNRDTIETVSVLAGLSNFVIANLSRPRSSPLEAQLVIPLIAVPFVPIIRRGERPFAMFTALGKKYPWVMPLVEYRNERDLIRNLRRRIVAPAESMATRLRRQKHELEGRTKLAQGRSKVVALARGSKS